jgi:7,8-dihydropterin-6-yl-methyl-4-(beta-D-ribofuranosyl)aminobenzene 5'-phosphate synthase
LIKLLITSVLFTGMAVAMTESAAGRDLSITVIYDNTSFKEGLETGWGFSCLVRGAEKTILFDTGGDGRRLLGNMAKLGIDPEDIDVIVLSHSHGDHTGGLGAVLEKNHEVAVYLLGSFPEGLKREIKGRGARVVEVRGPLEVCEGVYSTGELGTWMKEQALVVQTERGLVIITGCAHPGIVETVKKAKELIKDEVLLVTGGYHLGSKSREEIEGIISDFRKLGVRFVGPCHCTGDAAKQLLEREYRGNYIKVGAGRVMDTRNLR